MNDEERMISDLRNKLILIIEEAYHGKNAEPISQNSFEHFKHIHSLALVSHAMLNSLELLLFPDKPKPQPMPTVEAKKPGLCPPVLYTSRKRIKGGKP